MKRFAYLSSLLNSTASLTLAAVVTLFLSSCASTGDSGSASISSGGSKSYPLKTCLVTGNDLGSMGDEQRIVYQGQELKFCCSPCVEKFKKNPGKYLAKLR